MKHYLCAGKREVGKDGPVATRLKITKRAFASGSGCRFMAGFGGLGFRARVGGSRPLTIISGLIGMMEQKMETTRL